METLNNYIRESLLSDEEELIGDDNTLIEQFLKENYIIQGSYKISNNVVDVDGSVFLNSPLTQLTNGLFKFGKVRVNFRCFQGTLLSLDGSPEEVGGDFDCSDNSKLTSLEGSPETVGKNFTCSGTSIKDLTGAPSKVGGDFNCINCRSLKSIKGMPEKIGGVFNYYRTPAHADKSIERELNRKWIPFK